MSIENNKILIAGPCALESHTHARLTIKNAKDLGIDTVRMNLWKPRTKPGYEGWGIKGISAVHDAASQGMRPAMEVLLPVQAELLMNDIIIDLPHATLLLWIGSRNQNHTIQQEIGKIVAGEPRVKLMVKNQPWRDSDHWQGIVEHLMSVGVTADQLLLCHRGFAPWDKATSETRNVLDLDMALQLRAILGISLIMDPSHIGGRRDIVKKLVREFSQIPEVDGQIIEVHPDPTHALTDAKQQLSWSELQEALALEPATS